jgi:malonate transporter
MLGIPLALTQFGASAAPAVAMVAVIHSPVLFLVAALHAALISGFSQTQVASMDHNRSNDEQSTLRLVKSAAVDIIRNPIIIAIAAAVAYRASNLPLPHPGQHALDTLSRGTLPCILVALGVGLSSFRPTGQLGAVSIIAILKLSAMPCLAWWIGAIVFGLSVTDLAVVTFLSAMPVGANALIFANGGNDEESVSASVAITTMLSPISIGAVLFIVQQSAN